MPHRKELNIIDIADLANDLAYVKKPRLWVIPCKEQIKLANDKSDVQPPFKVHTR